MNEILMRLVLDEVLFLGLCGDDVVDPDTAVKRLEYIAFEVQSLSLADAEALRQFTLKRISELGEDSLASQELLALLEHVPVDPDRS